MRSRTRRLVWSLSTSLLLLMLLLPRAGYSSAAPTTPALSTAEPVAATPTQDTVLPVPHITQILGQPSQNCDCGPASVAMIARAYNKVAAETTNGQLVQQISTYIASPVCGTYAADLQDAFTTLFGLGTTLIPNGDGDAVIGQMRTAISQGKPVIAAINASVLGRAYAYHWVVVRGFSADGQWVYINDPDNTLNLNPPTGEAKWPISSFRSSLNAATENQYHGVVVGPGLANLPQGYIDGPPPNSTQQGTVTIGGWAKVNGATIDHVAIRIDGMLMGRATYGLPRSDGNPGWKWDWDTRVWPNGAHTIEVVAVTSQGVAAPLPSTNGTSFTIIVQNAQPQPLPDTPLATALHRYWSQARQKHFYTNSWAELGYGNSEWVFEGSIGYVARDTTYASAVTPLIRLWHPGNLKHFYTANAAEAQIAITQGGYVSDGDAGRVLTDIDTRYAQLPLYRLYKPSINNHFYTTNRAEAEHAMRNDSYVNEGIVGYVFAALKNRPPNNPTQLLPANNSASTRLTQTLTWSDAGDPDNYPRNYRDYWVSIRKVNSSWSSERPWNTATSWSVTLPSTGTYCWSVVSGDGETSSVGAKERCFAIYPVQIITLDSIPANANLTQGLTYQIRGWSAQLETPGGTNINKIHIYRDEHTGNGAFIGYGTYGLPRPDVAQVYGAQYLNSGYTYTWNTSGLSLGPHVLYIYSNSTLTGWSVITRTVNIVPAKRVFLPFARR